MIAPDRRLAALAIVLTLLIAFAKCETHVPTLTEISRFNDPVLSEVFESSGIKGKTVRPDSEDHPQLPPMAHVGQVPTTMDRMYVGEIPINHNQPLGPVMMRPNTMSAAVDTGVNALANGANALYRGAASVGQAFGFNPQAYEGQLFNAASQIFGKK